MVKKIAPITIVVLAALVAVFDLAHYGIPPTHDGEYHVMRFQQFYKILSEGSVYPRWAPDFNNGFGIPLFNYVYPLPNFLASFFHAFGFSFIDSLKLNMAAATLVGAIFMYLYAKKYWGVWGGVVSSIFYTFSPYHFLDIYVRGSVGEVWSLGLAPGLLWFYTNFLETRRKVFFVGSAVFLALLIFAHNILALLFFTFFITYAGFLIWGVKDKTRNIRDLIIIVVLGLGLSTIFWLPALIETKNVVGLQIFEPTEHFPVFYKLIYSSWGYGFSGLGEPDQMSFQIGIANILVFMGSVIVLFRMKNKKTQLFFISSFILTIFLITPSSIFIWKYFPMIGYIQFPWRLLSLAILLVSFLAGSLVSTFLFKKESRRQVGLAILLIFLSIGFSVQYAKAPFYHKRADSHYFLRSNFTDGTNSPGNMFNTLWLTNVPEKRTEKIEVSSKSAEIRINQVKSLSYNFSVKTSRSSEIGINTAYFPGWTAYIDGEKSTLKNNNGLLSLSIPQGNHEVIVQLEQTAVQRFATVLSLFSLGILLYFARRYSTIKKKS